MRWSAFGCVISLQLLVTWSCRSTCICWSMSQGAGSYPEPFRPSSCRFRCAAAKDPFGRRIITISTSHHTRNFSGEVALHSSQSGQPPQSRRRPVAGDRIDGMDAPPSAKRGWQPAFLDALSAARFPLPGSAPRRPRCPRPGAPST